MGLENICKRFIFKKDISESTHYRSHKHDLLYVPSPPLALGYGALRIPSQWDAFQVKWVHMLLSPTRPKWKSFVLHAFENVNYTSNYRKSRSLSSRWSLPPSAP